MKADDNVDSVEILCGLDQFAFEFPIILGWIQHRYALVFISWLRRWSVQNCTSGWHVLHSNRPGVQWYRSNWIHLPHRADWKTGNLRNRVGSISSRWRWPFSSQLGFGESQWRGRLIVKWIFDCVPKTWYLLRCVFCDSGSSQDANW